MRLLIGTLCCGEGDYPYHQLALERQRGVDCTVFSISGRSEHEAHDELYRRFMAEDAVSTLCVKIDADMVLSHDGVLLNILRQFQRDEELDQLVIPVRDFFTNGNIYGLHAYRPSVRWRQPVDRLFCDRSIVAETVRKKIRRPLIEDWGVLHAYFATEMQAFQYGLHRGAKVRRSANEGRQRFRRLVRHYRMNPSRRLLLALCGYLEGYGDGTDEVDPPAFASPGFMELFERLNGLDDEVLARRYAKSYVRRLLLAWGTRRRGDGP